MLIFGLLLVWIGAMLACPGFLALCATRKGPASARLGALRSIATGTAVSGLGEYLLVGVVGWPAVQLVVEVVALAAAGAVVALGAGEMLARVREHQQHRQLGLTPPN
jgi:hypothetical protein